MNYKHLLAASVFALGSSLACAVPISGLFNTGVNNSGVALANGAVDTHYTYSKTGGNNPGGASDSYNGTNGYTDAGTGFPFGPWVADSAASRWLTPSTDAGRTYDSAGGNGIYTWTLNFTILNPNANLNTATFLGRWATDNGGVMRLNGTQLANSTGNEAFGGFTSFSSAGAQFLQNNTLTFTVTNLQQGSGNPTGLRVEFLSSNVQTQGGGSSNDVPEPATLALLGLGLAGLGFARRRKQNAR